MRVLPDEFEDAFIGFAEKNQKKFIAIYDRKKCIDLVIENQKINKEDAILWFEKNVDEQLMEDDTPLILYPMTYIEYLGLNVYLGDERKGDY